MFICMKTADPRTAHRFVYRLTADKTTTTTTTTKPFVWCMKTADPRTADRFVYRMTADKTATTTTTTTTKPFVCLGRARGLGFHQAANQREPPSRRSFRGLKWDQLIGWRVVTCARALPNSWSFDVRT
ncbi:hypothetical protein ElyMa_006438000 [Elysia marginata]|uniref:Uncharacterized protein n=1 Tax=Elysia marginata TaxID=1093978 RepID=A0AAV4HVB1_9GAST|nr:hypothetical protein ElyMa_006438000 [Elysia marginata]